MPHEKGHLSPVTDTGAVAVDHREVMTITSDGKLDNCHIINPLKIPKRKGLFDESTDTNKANGGRKRPNFRKIHWTRLRPNRVSSNSAHRHNGRQADDKNVLANLDIKRRQVKVILTDVLQTEDGQRYLSDCKSDITEKTQTTHQRGSRRRERGLSTEQSRVRRRSSAPCKDQTNLSSIKLINSPSSKNDSVENDMQPSNELQSPAAKKIKRFNNSLKQPEHTAPDWEESYSFKQSHSLASKECQNLLPEHTASSDAAENILCPVEKSDSPMPTSVSLLHSEQISESVNTATDTPSKTKQPGGFQITEYQDSESEAVLTRQNPSEIESQECAEVMKEKEGAIELESEKEEPQQQKETVADEEGGTRGSVLRLSIGVTEDHLSDGEVTAKSSQTADSADKQLLNSELVEVKQTSKSQTTEPIVLSSEEEEDREDNGTKHVQAVEGDKELHKQQQPVQAMEWKKLPNVHICSSDLNRQDSSFKSSTLSVCPVMELPFSALFMGSFSAFNNGLVKITDDKITISFKDSLGTEVKAFLATAHVLKYSVWDGLLLRDSRLVKENEPPPPSILVLWLADVQAQRLSSELSVVQPGTCADVDSTCVLLCVHEPLNGIQGALLASIMDIVGLRHGNTELMSPLTYSDSLKILQDSHTLKLLLPRVETHPVSCESGAMPASSNTTTTSAKDLESQPDSGVYTVCQSRGQTVYCVSLAHKPAKDWTQYRHSGPARRLIQFPPPPSKGAITVTTEDLECLDSGEFLNDVIIDFYLKYLLVQKAPQASMRRSHIFSSFFFKQLTRRDNANEDSTSTPAQLRRHQRVRTWTRHVDIFEKDFLFVPVNQEAHWYLVVVCFPGLDEPQYLERGGHASVHDGDKNSTNDMTQSESHHGNGELNSDVISTRSSSAPCLPTCTESTCKQQTVCKRPCILIMDSLKLSVHERIFKILREYLQAEWEVKRGGNRDFSADRMVGSHCKVPLQDNSSDCGLYLLQYAESFLQDPVVHFDLPLKLECWFPRQKVREKRENIRDLVLHLYRFQQDSLGSDSLEDGKEMGNIV